MWKMTKKKNNSLGEKMMKIIYLLSLSILLVPCPLQAQDIDLTPDFVGEREMMESLLQMLADFSQYMSADYKGCDTPNNLGEACGCFMGERTMESNEAGVRTNADLSMLCAFLVKHGRPAGVRLPEGVTWELLNDIARKSLVFAYSTHKANRLKTCAKGDYWGSTGTSDHVWESSLWALSVAWSSFFQWEGLSEAQRTCIHRLLKAECDYELQRDIPTGYRGDTKAEENGWEAGVLAAAIGLFPDDPLAKEWWQRMREFAINSYSHPSDAENHSIIDPGDKATVADLYRGPNLYPDYTLQNHNLFHTSYQNVVMQELGEAALTLEMFQKGLGREERWKSNALMHHNREVMDSVLCWLALTDGELAMPNGNDWSLFLYDQITSYSTMATMMGDADALMLENRAWKHIRARQRTTTDGSWLLRPDVQARRMGVQGHRVMMTYLMHLAHSTANLQPTPWEEFRERHSAARLLPCQNVVRAFTKDRFTTFAWSEGLRSYTGYIAANSMDLNKTFVPFRAWNTGNLIGWYTVEGRRTDATPVVSGRHHLDGDSYTMSGELHTNQAVLDHRFAIYSTPGNAVLYTDLVTALDSGTITREQGGLTAISVDELTRTQRTLHHAGGSLTTNGDKQATLSTPWLNIDDELGLVCREAKAMAFGERANNNSVMTAKACPSYSEERRPFAKGELIDHRNIAWYSLVTAETTKRMAEQQTPLASMLPKGWNGQMAADPDHTHYLFVANFTDQSATATLHDLHCEPGAPVFDVETHITNSRSTTTLRLDANSCVGKTSRVFVEGDCVTATLVHNEETAAILTADHPTTVTLRIVAEGKTLEITKKLKAGRKTRFYLKNNKIRMRNEN